MRFLTTAAITLALGASLAGCASTADSGGGDDLMTLMYGAPAAESERIAARVADKPLGSRENPVRADMPAGQHAYLRRLRCSDGRAPAFERQGSAGIGPYGSIIDGYQVECAAGATPATSVIYMDMYRRHVETKAPPGFTIVP